MEKRKAIKPEACVGKHCLYVQYINDYTPTTQATEVDILEVNDVFMNVNMWKDNGNISNFWVAKGAFPIVKILGPAIFNTKVTRINPMDGRDRDFITGEEL